MLLFDAQTSGGLLLSVLPEKLGGLLERAAQVGQMLWEVGEVIEGGGIEVVH
jgi:selenophosphate synthase